MDEDDFTKAEVTLMLEDASAVAARVIGVISDVFTCVKDNDPAAIGNCEWLSEQLVYAALQRGVGKSSLRAYVRSLIKEELEIQNHDRKNPMPRNPS